MELGGDRFEDRGLAGPVLADQKRDLRVELPRLLEGPDRGQREWERVRVRDAI
jgi:hypothetical protein